MPSIHWTSVTFYAYTSTRLWKSFTIYFSLNSSHERSVIDIGADCSPDHRFVVDANFIYISKQRSAHVRILSFFCSTFYRYSWIVVYRSRFSLVKTFSRWYAILLLFSIAKCWLPHTEHRSSALSLHSVFENLLT